jgi:hypothetical protein
VASKKQGTSASADSANDAVPVDETVRVPQNLINDIELKGIDLRIDCEAVLALATVSREAFVCYNEFVSINRRSGKALN